MSEWESLRITEMSKDRREGSKENSRAQRDTVEKEAEVAPSIFTAMRLSDWKLLRER